MNYAVTDPVPVLSPRGSDINVVIRSKPLTQTIISITSSDPSSMRVSKQMITLSLQSNTASYTIQANETGLFSVSYNIIPGSLYTKPEDSIFLVTSNENAPSDSQVLQSGLLVVGCCSKQLTLSPHQCSSNLTLHSSCQWDNIRYSTEGTVHLSVASLYLPVSIAGLRVNNNPTVSFTTHYSTDQCLTCDKAPNQQCQRTRSIFDYNTNTIKSILQDRSLVVSFFSSIKSFLPSWLTVEIFQSASSYYSSYDFMTSIGTSSEVKRLPGCDKFDLMDTPSLIYALRTTTRILLTIDNHPAFHYPQASSPFCILIDMCNGLTPTLHSMIPPSLVTKERAASIRALNVLMTDSTHITLKSISLQENGIAAPKLQPLAYWNGSHYFYPTYPLRYQYKLDVELRREFTGHNLQADITFKGSVYYQPNATGREVCH